MHPIEVLPVYMIQYSRRTNSKKNKNWWFVHTPDVYLLSINPDIDEIISIAMGFPQASKVIIFL